MISHLQHNDTLSCHSLNTIFSLFSLSQFDDNNEIKDMKIETVDSTKQLFVSTISKIYRLPLERCSRYITCRSVDFLCVCLCSLLAPHIDKISFILYLYKWIHFLKYIL